MMYILPDQSIVGFQETIFVILMAFSITNLLDVNNLDENIGDRFRER